MASEFVESTLRFTVLELVTVQAFWVFRVLFRSGEVSAGLPPPLASCVSAATEKEHPTA